MVRRYTLFQREAGSVGASGKHSLTDCKVEDKQNKDPNKKEPHSNYLQSQHPFCQLSSIYINGTWITYPVSELFNVTEEPYYWLLFQKRKDMWCWVQTCPAVLFCIKTSCLSLETLQIFSRLQIQKFEIWESWDLSKMRWGATLLPLFHFNILLLSRSGIL